MLTQEDLDKIEALISKHDDGCLILILLVIILFQGCY